MTGDFHDPQEALAQAKAGVPPLVRSRERWRLWAYIGLLVSDLGLLLAAFLAAGWLRDGIFPHPTTFEQAQLLLPIYFTIALYNSTYSLRALEDARFAIGRATLALLVSAALLNFVLFYAKTSALYSRLAFTLAMGIAFVLISGSRLLARRMIRQRWRDRTANILVIADGGPEIDLKGAMLVRAQQVALDPASHDPHALDRLGRYLLNQDKVIVSCPPAKREQWAWVLKAAGVTGEVVSENAHAAGAIGVTRYESAGTSALVVSMGPLGMRARAIKRGFDVVVAGGGLLVMTPVMLIAALAIKLQDGGPVLFVQHRVGRGNRLFPMFKFRTMKAGIPGVDGARSASRYDERVTWIGRMLRRTSIDELPQLWNVLRGEMAIVGPRPHALGSLAGEKLFWEVDSRYWHRHSLKPGLTGLAQVRGLRGATEQEMDLAVRLQADLEYIAGWNLWRDIAIAIRTLFVLVHRRAY
ncbi:sugar transferase [Altererythrobacter sp. MF3-039]|uniref:sugar transferase n=1 Tax=Altererythrobacter sp. MF3-039 TaxID=3252901 RepID=UPI00390C440C